MSEPVMHVQGFQPGHKVTMDGREVGEIVSSQMEDGRYVVTFRAHDDEAWKAMTGCGSMSVGVSFSRTERT